MSLAVTAIQILHLMFLIFIVTVPFLNVPWQVTAIYISTSLSLLVHWLLNDNTCFLTLLESKLRNIEPEHSFMYSLVSPVYSIHETTLSTIAYTFVTFALLWSLYVIYQKRNEIKGDMKNIWRFVKGNV